MTNPDWFVIALSRAPMLMAAGLLMFSLLVSAQASASDRPDTAVRAMISVALRELKRWLARLRSEGDAVLTRQLIERITLPHLDLTRMARYVLGSYWQSATPSQCERFRRAFRAHLLQLCSRAMAKHATELTQFVHDVRVHYRLARYDVARRTATVQVIAVTQSLGWVQLELQLHDHDGSWKIYEITSSGINILVGIRSDLQAQLRCGDLETVIRRLEHRVGLPNHSP
ncbi:MlaC/ttg2D family ABC transporter substrate-binding protein [Nitrococcus mobilis]|uniref:Toluene tolerance n=1 Tax=Nitrococcus mobilis Nb-231 TaxID=314278 RepID=A4BR74_9GAMM|nr:ABC transporter substrate-binding protein [Nitrococcus mobilis]EAR21696.1 Toluene tolerance [Nitrococcus mobilis Nb-231]